MKRNFLRPILVVFAFAAGWAFFGMRGVAQTGHQHANANAQVYPAMSESEPSGVINEPHYVLSIAYLQTASTFARALHDQAQSGRPLSADFARAAVDEITRSMYQADEHRQEHLKTRDQDLPAKVPTTPKEMDMRHSRLDDAISVLEKDVQNYTLNSKQIAGDCVEVLKRLDDLSGIT